MAFLALYNDSGSERLFHLGDDATIGRTEEADITIDDSRVSRRHARITRRGDDFMLEDLGSSNGTFVREEELRPNKPVKLVDGDDIRVGSCRLNFRLYRFVSASGEQQRPVATGWAPNPPR